MTGRHRRLMLVRITEVIGAVVLIVGSGLVYAGVAEPYISPPAFVFGKIAVLVPMLGGAILLVVRPSSSLQNRYWRTTATEAGFTSESRESADTVVWTGTVQGRTVHARTGSTKALSSASSQGQQAYTLVEAELTREASDGLVVGPSEQDALVTPYDVASHADYETDELVALSNSDDLAESVLSGRVREALLAVDDLQQVYIGNARVAADTLPDDDRMTVGTPAGITRAVDAAHDPEMTGGDWLGGRKWVTHVTDGVTLDPDELRRQAEAVAAIADVFDETVREVEGQR